MPVSQYLYINECVMGCLVIFTNLGFARALVTMDFFNAIQWKKRQIEILAYHWATASSIEISVGDIQLEGARCKPIFFKGIIIYITFLTQKF